MSSPSLPIQSSINDAGEFKEVSEAMKVIGFKPEEIQTAYKVLAAILHLVSRCEYVVEKRGRKCLRFGYSAGNQLLLMIFQKKKCIKFGRTPLQLCQYTYLVQQ